VSELGDAGTALQPDHDTLLRRLAEVEDELQRERQARCREGEERARAELAIRTSEEKYRTLFEESLDAIVITLADGRVVDLNQAAVEMVGAPSRAQALQHKVLDFYADRADRARFLTALADRGFVKGYELSLKRLDGTPIVVHATSVPMRDGAGQVVGTRTTLRDVTAQHRLREELSQAQKMEAVGRLAGGVAHQFNNLLTAIIGHAELLSSAIGNDSEARAHLDEIREGARRGANLTQRLLAFGRRQISQPQRLDLNEVVGSVRRLLRRSIGEQVVVEIAPEAAPALVEADLSQIEQVIVNLALNARDAMPQGGTLRLATSNRIVTESPEAAAAGLEPGPYVVLQVEDTGTGIADDIREHIFEPFFTTKTDDGGTGLGLAAVHGIVTRSGGSVRWTSSRGRGTTFEVLWPAASAATETAQAAVTAAAGLGEIVLVVDDDPGVRSLTSRVLSSQGFLTLEASGGAEAIDLFAQQAGKVGVLVSDVVMPGIQGPDLVERLRRSAPNLRVVLMSGYTEALSDIVDSEVDSLTRFLQKPFSPADLVALIRELSEPG
jgi:two-component system, cell cycle sensor histidine kinase and response regulator CckA